MSRELDTLRLDGRVAIVTGGAKATTGRLLYTLHTAGYLQTIGTVGEYALSSKLIQMSAPTTGHEGTRRIASPHLTQLSEETQETGHLGVIEQGRVLYMDKFDPGPDSPRFGGRPERPSQCHCARHPSLQSSQRLVVRRCSKAPYSASRGEGARSTWRHSSTNRTSSPLEGSRPTRRRTRRVSAVSVRRSWGAMANRSPRSASLARRNA